MLMAGDLKYHRHKIFVRSAQIFVPTPDKTQNRTKATGALKWSWTSNKISILEH